MILGLINPGLPLVDPPRVSRQFLSVMVAAWLTPRSAVRGVAWSGPHDATSVDFSDAAELAEFLTFLRTLPPATPATWPCRCKTSPATLVACQNSSRASDLVFYPRRSCSSASSICSWSGRSAGWRSSRAAAPRRTWRSWRSGARPRSCAARFLARSRTGLTAP
jgi:hypothetical protein